MKASKIGKLSVWLLVATLAACGGNNEDNNNNGEPNNGTPNNGEPNSDPNNGEPNSDPNNGEPNSDPNNDPNNNPNNNPNPTADVQEVEPNGFEDNWTPFNPGQTIGGTIAAGSGDTSDIDVFQVELTGGTFIEFGFEHLGADFADNAVLLFEDENGDISRNILPGGPLKRQTYVPFDGTYLIGIADIRAFGDEPVQHGGENATYIVSLDMIDVTPTNIEVPSTTSGDQSDGSIQAYTVTPANDGAVVVETTAGRPPVSSDLDTVLYVLANGAEIVGYSDDGASEDSYDSRAVFAATAGTTYTVVVDHYSAVSNGAYSLELSETDDDISAPRELVIGTPLTGVIDELASGFDTDYFVITLDPGEVVRVVVEAEGGLRPAVTAAFDSIFGVLPFTFGYDVNDVAALEFSHGTDETDPFDYYIFVDDVRNVGSETPANVGGAGYSYTVTATSTSWTPTDVTLPYTTAGSIAAPGNTNWFNVDVPADHVLIASATTTNSDFAIGIATLEGGYDYVEADLVAEFVDVESTLTVGVRDYWFRGGAGWDYTPNFRTINLNGFPTVDEVEPNDTNATAQALTLPVEVTATLDGEGSGDVKPDVFAIEVTAGQVIGVRTGSAGDPDLDADTIIEILNPDGTQLFENDDYSGQSGTFFSGGAVVATATGTHHVVVTPYCPGADDCSGNGDYTLKVFVD